jgi:hypothetical protein
MYHSIQDRNLKGEIRLQYISIDEKVAKMYRPHSLQPRAMQASGFFFFKQQGNQRQQLDHTT